MSNNKWRSITPDFPEYEVCLGLGVRHKKTKEMVKIRRTKRGMKYCLLTKVESGVYHSYAVAISGLFNNFLSI